MRLAALAFSATLMMSGAGQAFVTAPCGPEFTAENITEPWEETTRVFANGAIRIFEIFIDPNVASGAALGILHPLPNDPPGPYRTCTAIYMDPEFLFFGQAFIAEATAVYDPAQGLVITVPVSLVNEVQRRSVTFAVNQATGVVTLL